MNKEGTFEYQRDKYARMLVDLMSVHSDKFDYRNNMSVIECTAAVNTFFDVRMDPRWLDILVKEYPDVFSFENIDDGTKFHVASDLSHILEM